MTAASLGTLAIWLAAASAVGAIAVSLRRRSSTSRLVAVLLATTAFAAAVATAVLAYALVARDYSLVYVVETTSNTTPGTYRLAALWGANQGSLLFLAALLAIVSAVSSWMLQRRAASLAVVAGRVMALVVGALLVAVATIAFPFDRLAIPATDGSGLVAILRHPAMLIHPPILYLGHTTLLVPFALTAAALAAGRIDAPWLRLVRPWLVAAWTALTLGMVGGSMWAYIELGWGGFWAWDAVENSALMPWLAVTAFLHSSRLQQRTARLGRWNASLAMLPFVLSTLGIYLTRSGLTGSVHAFADSAAVGRFALALFAASAIGAGGVLLRHRSTDGGWRLRRSDPWHAINVFVMLWALLVVALGATYPLLSRILGEAVTVAPRWYVVMLFVPALIGLSGMALAPRSPGADMSTVRMRALWLGAGAVAAFALMAAAGVRSLVPMLILAPAAAAALILGWDLVRRRAGIRHVAAGLAHMGVALVLAGAAGSALGSEFHGAVAAGDVIDVGGHEVTIADIAVGREIGFSFVAVEVGIGSSDVIVPEWRGYNGSVRPTPEPALRTGLVDDVVVAISRVSEDASLVWLDVFVRPMVLWVWLGALLIGVSGPLVLVTKDGSALGRRQSATAAPPPTETTADTSML